MHKIIPNIYWRKIEFFLSIRPSNTVELYFNWFLPKNSQSSSPICPADKIARKFLSKNHIAASLRRIHTSFFLSNFIPYFAHVRTRSLGTLRFRDSPNFILYKTTLFWNSARFSRSAYENCVREKRPHPLFSHTNTRTRVSHARALLSFSLSILREE